MSHRKCKNKSNDPKEMAEKDEIAPNANAKSSLNKQKKPNNLSSTDSGEDHKGTDTDLKGMKFKKIIGKIESQLKEDANDSIMSILESLLKIGDCVEKRDLRFEILKKFVRHLQECDAKGVMEASRITRGMLTSDELKKLIVDNTSVSETLNVIARGTFSTITLGRLKQPDGKKKKVAIKTVNPPIKEYLINEAEVMAHLDHVNIVKIFAFQKGDTDKLIMEYFELGDLVKCIRGRQISNGQYLRFLHDIATGMEYMTAKNYVHGDLACRNVFVKQNLQCKIGDFGYSHFVGDSDGLYEITAGNRRYPIALGLLPPESRTSGNIILSWKTDVWSMGILIWEVFTLDFQPFVQQLILEQFFFGFVSELPNVGKCPRPLYEYNTSKIMSADPNKRPTFTMIKNTISEML